MFYLKTKNATRPFKVGNDHVVFEPVRQASGGIWLGVFATADKSVANDLASYPQISAITADEYADLKKNKSTDSNLRVSPVPPRQSPLPEAHVELAEPTEPPAPEPQPSPEPPAETAHQDEEPSEDPESDDLEGLGLGEVNPPGDEDVLPEPEPSKTRVGDDSE